MSFPHGAFVQQDAVLNGQHDGKQAKVSLEIAGDGVICFSVSYESTISSSWHWFGGSRACHGDGSGWLGETSGEDSSSVFVAEIGPGSSLVLSDLLIVV